jgi:phenylpyruvate tautomerase PptA (4-oxalocrotonate tautomerase family)
MPVAYVDIPPGLPETSKKKVFTEIYHATHEAWPIPDTRVLIREWPNQSVSLDGRVENVPMRPIVTLAVPPGLPVAGKRKVIKRISDVLGEVCHREVEEIRLPSGTTVRMNWVLTFFWELPLDQVGLGEMLASENPMVLENPPTK